MNSPELARQYETSTGVKSRFILYNFVEKPLDVDRVMYEEGVRSKDENILVIGSSDGDLPERISTEFQHTGLVVGVDKFYHQFYRSNTMNVTDATLTEALTDYDIDVASVDRAVHDYEPVLYGVPFYEVGADAVDLPFASDTFDVVMAPFVFYHLKDHERGKALREVMRVMKPKGRFVHATSGSDNKSMHRASEGKNAAELSEMLGVHVSPPQKMNDGFTTEKALRALSTIFPIVHSLIQSCEMRIETLREVNLYIGSQDSLYELYDPVPPRDKFLEVLNLLRNALLREIVLQGYAKDNVSRSIQICTSDPTYAPVRDDFELIPRG